MGTNVYAIKKNPRGLVNWKKLEEAVTNEDPWSLLEETEGLYDILHNGNRIHIGKRSYGWRFIFDFNNWIYFDHTEESIKKFLTEDVWGIEDEYGQQLSFDEFWKDFALCNPTGLTSKEYEVNHGTNYSRIDAERHDWYESTWSPAGPIPKDLPYRFSNYTDFS